MASQAGYGTVLKVYDMITDYAFETVGGVRDITAPGLELDALDATAHDSTSAYMESKAGILNGSTLSIEIFYDGGNATHQLFYDLMSQRKSTLVQIVWPDNTQDNFLVFVNRFSPSAPVEDMLTATVEMTVNGFPLLDDTSGFDFMAQEDGSPLLTEGGDVILLNNLLS